MSEDNQDKDPSTNTGTDLPSQKDLPPAASKTTSAQKPDSKKSRLALWLLLLLFLVLAVAAAMGYFGWQWQQQQLAGQSELRQDVERLAGLRSLPDRLRALELVAEKAQTSTNDRASLDQWRENRESIASLAQELQQQRRLLQSMSTTTRSDWQLAEAEYLLRLANQRILMERSVDGALALLESADDILRQLDDMQLFSVREQLSSDITELKLTNAVDRSGLYLRLSALARQALKLPVAQRPRSEEIASESAIPQDASLTGLWQKLRHNFVVAMKKLGDQVRIRRNDKPLEPMLPPDAESYLRQNIAFNIEQAQLALLREQDLIYRDSLGQARALLQQYLPGQTQAQTIAAALGDLAKKDVKIQLPDISGSLNALHNFNTRLHKLDDGAGEPQLQPAAQVEASLP